MPQLSAAQHAAIQIIAAGLDDATFDWALTGSMSFALQGVAIVPNDIDLQTDAMGAYACAERFAAAIVQPVQFLSAASIRSHFGALLIAGVKVEIMGALQKRLANGEWEEPVRVAEHRVWVRYGELRLPALDLAYEARAYRMMGRIARAERLEEFLARPTERQA